MNSVPDREWVRRVQVGAGRSRPGNWRECGRARGRGRVGATTRAWIPWGLAGQVSGGGGRAICGLLGCPDDGPWMEGHTTGLVATQDRVFSHYVPNSSIKHSKSDSKDRSQEIL
jgi:hypothetical protein